MAGDDRVRGHTVTTALLLVTNAQSLCVRGQVHSTNCSIQSGQREHRGGKRHAFVSVLERQLAPRKGCKDQEAGTPFSPHQALAELCGW